MIQSPVGVKSLLHPLAAVIDGGCGCGCATPLLAYSSASRRWWVKKNVSSTRSHPVSPSPPSNGDNVRLHLCCCFVWFSARDAASNVCVCVCVFLSVCVCFCMCVCESSRVDCNNESSSDLQSFKNNLSSDLICAAGRKGTDIFSNNTRRVSPAGYFLSIPCDSTFFTLFSN